MKKKTILMWALIIPLSAALLISGCKKDEEEECPEVNYTELDAKITEAQAMHDAAVEGTNPGEYLPGAKADLQTAIDLAQAVRDKDCVTQTELDNAVVALDEAMATFEDQKVTDVAPGALVAHWKFNGDATDASGNGHDGTVSAGHPEWGGGMPALAEDRHGNADYCYMFQDGGNIVVPNSPDFRPTDLSISVWMNLYETWPHNYFISNDIWHTWKFQVQDANKPFFTAHITDDATGDEAYIDKDSNTGILELDTWYHVVMTYTKGKMIFYIDGVKVQEWDDFPSGDFIAPHDGIDLCIGQALATDDFDDDLHKWEEWLGFFKGYLDDMRIYNTVLTDAQVTSLHEYEANTTIE
mgnify:CR=1 FL=1